MPVALVTGASSGIGKEFARALSARGYELVLVARRAELLAELAAELPGTAHPVACDLETDAASLPGRVEELGLHVDVLVNNAGFGTYGRFVQEAPERLTGQVRVNCEAVVELTRAFLPGMVERNTGGVITVASTAGAQPIPYEAVYSASKAFARTFMRALRTELRSSGLKFLTVDPGPVKTDWQEVAGYDEPGQTHGVPSLIGPEQVAKEALEAWDAGRSELVPDARMRWFMRATGWTPLAVKLRVVERGYRPKS